MGGGHEVGHGHDHGHGHHHHEETRLTRYIKAHSAFAATAQPADVHPLSHPHHSSYSVLLERAHATGNPIFRSKLNAHFWSWGIWIPGLLGFLTWMDPNRMWPRILGIRGGGPYFAADRNVPTKKRLGL